MSNHLCTSESLLAGAIEAESACLICRNRTIHRIGYVASECTGCGNVYTHDDYGQICRMRREYLGLSRQEIADLYGVKEQTIAEYEGWPAKKYWKWMLNLKMEIE